MEQYLVGSYKLGLSQNKDVDYVAIIDGDDKEYHRHKFADGADYFFRTKANLDSYMLFEREINYDTVRKYIYNFQYDKTIIAEDFPYKYDIFSQREKYIELLNWIVDNKALNFNKDILVNINNGKALSKNLYLVSYLTFIMENNSTTLTAEQRAIVQKIHDKQMPLEYLDVLAKKIRNLK